MTIREALNLGYKKTRSTLDTEVLLSHALDKSKEFLTARPDEPLTPTQEKKFLTLVSRRQLGWPVAYLTGQKEFFGHKFFLTKDVLVPRPETETLVELVLQETKNQKSMIKILDVGTGSGCIIISLAATLRNAELDSASRKRDPETSSGLRKINPQFFASDLSEKALKMAKKNSKLHKVKITFRQGSLLTPWRNQKFDIIVANLPYLAKLEHSSTKFEPKKALIAANKGLAWHEKLFKQIASCHPEFISGSRNKFGMTKTPIIFIEIDPRQKEQIKSLAYKYLPGFRVTIYKDLTGKNRVARLFSP